MDRNTVDYDVNRKMWCTFNAIAEIFWTDGMIQVRTVLCLAIMLIGKGFDTGCTSADAFGLMAEAVALEMRKG